MRHIFLGFKLLLTLFAGISALCLSAQTIPDSLIRHHEFVYRMQLAYERMTGSRYQPVFNRDFILADIDPDPANPRRFYNFSGDLSGRFFEVIAGVADKRTDYHQLMREALKYQRADGRFGDAQLQFTAAGIGGEHMALLWGNGRFLVGLMEYYRHFKNRDVLNAAIKLGNFFKHTYDACSTPEVVAKLEGFGAKGIICFTQYIEGLVMLSEATEDTTYANAAAKTYHLIGKRGVQHSHGYLTTLRGVHLLYDYTGNKTYLDFVRDAVDELLASGDMTLYSSVKEFFGNIHDRDEGCSTADLLRVCLALHRSTGEPKYLQAAESTLYNAMYFNQYNTGDFGHHNLHSRGSGPGTIMAAWWCCTMHGLRALQDIKDNYAMRKTANGYQWDMYIESDYRIDGFSGSCRRVSFNGKDLIYELSIHSIKEGQSFRLRVPEWSEQLEVTYRGVVSSALPGQSNLDIPNLRSGDRLLIRLSAKARIRTADGTFVAAEGIGNQQINGSLFVGPFLMGVEQRNDPEFCAEPNENLVFINTLRFRNDGICTADVTYSHNGFPSLLKTTLTPVSRATFIGHSYQLARIDFAGKGTGSITEEQLKSILNPSRNK